MLADDHPIVLAGIKSLLMAGGAYDVVAVCSNGVDALARIREFRPDFAVLDVTMPGMTGIEVLEALKAEGAPVRVVILTASPADEEIGRLVAAGPAGFMLKEAAADELVACLERIQEGRNTLPAQLIEPALARLAAEASKSQQIEGGLTSREREIAILIAEGMTNKEIARKVGITEGTVKLHLHKVFQKLNVPNRASLATKMLQHRRPAA